jgi:GDPmannose 4,6-dehydratase
MGNLSALRDWGHAKDFVRMQWLMLQQAQAEDFVIATGQQVSVRDFIGQAARELGIELAFEGEGLHECARVRAIHGPTASALKVGDVIVRVDARYFRPTEVETLLGDPGKAKAKLGWVPEISLTAMIQEMVRSDLDRARQHALLKQLGYGVPVSRED